MKSTPCVPLLPDKEGDFYWKEGYGVKALAGKELVRGHGAGANKLIKYFETIQYPVKNGHVMLFSGRVTAQRNSP